MKLAAAFVLCLSFSLSAFAAPPATQLPLTTKRPEINRPIACDGPFFPPDPYQCDGPDDTDCDCY